MNVVLPNHCRYVSMHYQRVAAQPRYPYFRYYCDITHRYYRYRVTGMLPRCCITVVLPPIAVTFLCITNALLFDTVTHISDITVALLIVTDDMLLLTCYLGVTIMLHYCGVTQPLPVRFSALPRFGNTPRVSRELAPRSGRAERPMGSVPGAPTYGWLDGTGCETSAGTQRPSIQEP